MIEALPQETRYGKTEYPASPEETNFVTFRCGTTAPASTSVLIPSGFVPKKPHFPSGNTAKALSARVAIHEYTPTDEGRKVLEAFENGSARVHGQEKERAVSTDSKRPSRFERITQTYVPTHGNAFSVQKSTSFETFPARILRRASPEAFERNEFGTTRHALPAASVHFSTKA